MDNAFDTVLSVSNDLSDIECEFFELGGRLMGNCLALRHCVDAGFENYLQSLVADYFDYCKQYHDLTDRFSYLISLQQDLIKEDLEKVGAYGAIVKSD